MQEGWAGGLLTGASKLALGSGGLLDMGCSLSLLKEAFEVCVALNWSVIASGNLFERCSRAPDPCFQAE